MPFLKNHQIKALAKKATDYVIAQLVDYLKFSEQITREGKKRETENEALQVLFYIFMKKNNRGIPLTGVTTRCRCATKAQIASG